MICGLKWKSCNCPWFNYETVEADRLLHMRIPQRLPFFPNQPDQQNRQNQPNPSAQNDEEPLRPHHRRRPPPPVNYNDEINQRRRQEREDEAYARRLQRMSLDGVEDFNGAIGELQGIGNGAGHFMNQDYIRAAQDILSGANGQANGAPNYVMGVRAARGMPRAPPPPGFVPGIMAQPLPPPAPLLRRHTMREQVYNSAASTRSSERVIPARTRTDYASEAAVHTPRGRLAALEEVPTQAPANSSNGRLPHRAASVRSEARLAVLAGLGGRGSNRVDAWRTFVPPGAPEDGVLSI